MIGEINIESKKEQEIYIISESIAYKLAELSHNNKKKEISKEVLFYIIATSVDKEIIDEVYKKTINLLEEKYNFITIDDSNNYEKERSSVDI